MTVINRGVLTAALVTLEADVDRLTEQALVHTAAATEAAASVPEQFMEGLGIDPQEPGHDTDAKHARPPNTTPLIAQTRRTGHADRPEKRARASRVRHGRSTLRHSRPRCPRGTRDRSPGPSRLGQAKNALAAGTGTADAVAEGHKAPGRVPRPKAPTGRLVRIVPRGRSGWARTIAGGDGALR